MNKNFWGEPDDIEPLPDWMLAETYRNGGKPKKDRKSTRLNSSHIPLSRMPSSA